MKNFSAVSPAFKVNILHEARFQGKIEKSDDCFFVYAPTEGWGIYVRFFENYRLTQMISVVRFSYVH